MGSDTIDLDSYLEELALSQWHQNPTQAPSSENAYEAVNGRTTKSHDTGSSVKRSSVTESPEKSSTPSRASFYGKNVNVSDPMVFKRLSQENAAAAAVVKQEMNNVKALKRLSIGALSTLDPDLPPEDLSSSRNEPSESTMPGAESPPGSPNLSHHSSADMAISPSQASEFLWVPANVHPELAPQEWKSFVQKKVAEIKASVSSDSQPTPSRLSSSSSSSEHSSSSGEYLKRTPSTASASRSTSLSRRNSRLSTQIKSQDDFTDGRDVLRRKSSQSSTSSNSSDLSSISSLSAHLSTLGELESLAADPFQLARSLTGNKGQYMTGYVTRDNSMVSTVGGSTSSGNSNSNNSNNYNSNLDTSSPLSNDIALANDSDQPILPITSSASLRRSTRNKYSKPSLRGRRERPSRIHTTGHSGLATIGSGSDDSGKLQLSPISPLSPINLEHDAGAKDIPPAPPSKSSSSLTSDEPPPVPPKAEVRRKLSGQAGQISNLNLNQNQNQQYEGSVVYPADSEKPNPGKPRPTIPENSQENVAPQQSLQQAAKFPTEAKNSLQPALPLTPSASRSSPTVYAEQSHDALRLGKKQEVPRQGAASRAVPRVPVSGAESNTLENQTISQETPSQDGGVVPAKSKNRKASWRWFPKDGEDSSSSPNSNSNPNSSPETKDQADHASSAASAPSKSSKAISSFFSKMMAKDSSSASNNQNQSQSSTPADSPNLSVGSALTAVSNFGGRRSPEKVKKVIKKDGLQGHSRYRSRSKESTTPTTVVKQAADIERKRRSQQMQDIETQLRQAQNEQKALGLNSHHRRFSQQGQQGQQGQQAQQHQQQQEEPAGYNSESSSALARKQEVQAAIKEFKRLQKQMQVQAQEGGFQLPYDIPAHQMSDKSLVMMYHRYPIHIERAIYRLSHLKLANPRRPLVQQVLLSNFMYAYLNLLNHGYRLQQQQLMYEQQQQQQVDGGYGYEYDESTYEEYGGEQVQWQQQQGDQIHDDYSQQVPTTQPSISTAIDPEKSPSADSISSSSSSSSSSGGGDDIWTGDDYDASSVNPYYQSNGRNASSSAAQSPNSNSNTTNTISNTHTSRNTNTGTSIEEKNTRSYQGHARHRRGVHNPVYESGSQVSHS